MDAKTILEEAKQILEALVGDVKAKTLVAAANIMLESRKRETAEKARADKIDHEYHQI